ncbi:hypothetical protein EDC02_4038 [Micromonospora sp. Llam0]|nr:hypothetical protein EDC02_4038 [Micromonospora sp. Llam0]
MYVNAGWTGWGVIIVPLWVLSVCGGPYAAVRLLYDLAVQGDDGIDHSGVPLGGLAVGLLAGGAVISLLGLALNRRRGPGGGWIWTERHAFADIPVENVGRHTFVAGALLLPLGAVGFLPAPAVWALVAGWTAVVIGALVWHRRAKARATGRARTQ